MPILSPFSRQYTRRRDALLSFLVAGFACLVLLAASCRETSAQEAIERDAIRRIERDYNVGEANRRLTVRDSTVTQECRTRIKPDPFG